MHARRVLCNDDGWILSAHEGEPPLTPDMIWEQSIGPRQGTPIDTFLWSVAGNEIYTYETAVGERFGDGYDPSVLDGPSARKLSNLRYLQQQHGGALPVHIELAHRAGMRFLASFRMNQHYGAVEDGNPWDFSSMRRERPELAIGRPGETLSPDNLEWGIRTGLNFACEEVRRHHIDICAEMVDCWDVDGIELDFMRHPAFFRVNDAVAGGHLLTDMVAAIKAAVDVASSRKGRSMELVVRVPPTIYDCHRIGIEISRWIARGLVDVVVAGEGWIAHTAPIADFVELARQRGLTPENKSTPKRPLILGPFEALNQTLHPDELNAVAARYWADGVDGLYLFNYYSMSHQWRTTTLAQMADPQGSLRYATKRYRLDLGRGKERPNSTLGIQMHGDRACRICTAGPCSNLSPCHDCVWPGFSFMNAVPATILPVELRPSLGGLGCELPLAMVDDPKSDVDVFESVTLGLGLVGYHVSLIETARDRAFSDPT